MRFEYVQRVFNQSPSRSSTTEGWPRQHEPGNFIDDPRFRSDWWTAIARSPSVAVEVRLDSAEVARLILNRSNGMPDYVGKPSMNRPLEIVKIEVASDLTGRGIASAVVDSLSETFSDRTLVAMASKSAEPFWNSLGWVRCLRGDMGEDAFPYFIQPEPGQRES